MAIDEESNRQEGAAAAGSTRSTLEGVAARAHPLRIGHYHVRRVISSGGMGTVYEALQEHPRRTVAVKVMSPGVVSRSALGRFEHESQILARLRHPNIAQVVEAGMHREGGAVVPYFVMEYIPSPRSITEYAREHHLGIRQKLELFAKVCDAVQHGHEKGVIHRDLKPGNILVDAEGVPKVIDFGVARATDSDLAITTLQTDVGQLIGTLQYMSPEQVEADPHAIDARSDVYALGVVLYELLCGRLPYDVSGVPMLEAARIIKQDPPTRLSTIDAKLRGDLETIVLTALAKDRTRRYRTAAELGQDLERYLHDEPILARRPTVHYLLGRRTRAIIHRHPVGTMVAVILAAFVAAEIVGFPVVHRWTPLYEWFKEFIGRAPWPAPGSDTLASVRVIRITDLTAGVAGQTALDEGLRGVDPAHWPSMRRLHGRLMERLAGAGVRSVTWNLSFRGPSEFDEDFVRGAQALRDAGVDVVVGVPEWPLRESPLISETIAGHVRWGGPTANFDDKAPWNLHLFAQREGSEPVPSLVLASLAAALRPGAEVFITPDRRDDTLKLGYFRRYGDRQEKQWLPGTDEIALSRIEPYAPPADEPPLGRKPGDQIGIYIVELPGDPVLEASAMDYEGIFRTSGEDLRQRLGGKAVIVGDFRRAAARTFFPHPDGRVLSATWGFAAGLDMLLGGGVIRVERTASQRVGWLLAAGLGVLIALVATGRPLLRLALLGAATVGSLCLSVLLYHELQYFLNPLVPLLAMVVACELAVWINRVRHTHLA
jgi:serine/threonine-protein kinase RIO1